MNQGREVDLVLDDDGWLKLDSASISVRGVVSRIIEEMQSIVDDAVVVSLCERLGVCSAGFLFHDTLKNVTRFYKEDEAAPTYKTRYLWDDRRLHADWSDCVHWLFVKVRESQYSSRRSGDAWAEDYFVNLPLTEEERRSMLPERRWRARFGVHYCSVGEMLYTAVVWRALAVARDLGWGEHSLGEAVIALEQRTNVAAPCRWRGELLLRAKAGSLANDAEATFSQWWGQSLGPQQTWHEEWPALLLACSDVETQYSHRAAVVQFIRTGGFAESGVPDDCTDDGVLNQAIQRSIPAYLEWLGEGHSRRTVTEAIEVIERQARFPVLPFYVWNALNLRPRCYGVIPIWTSQNHSIEVPFGECRHLGLALTGLRPVAEWDWTLDGQGDSSVSKTKPLVLINLLRLMARPLVEGNLYECLWQELTEGLDDDFEGGIRDYLDA